MKAPQQLRIGPFDWRLCLDEAVENADERGNADLISKEIRFAPRLKPKEAMGTFFHEVFHIMEFLWDLEAIEHRQVRQLAHGLLDVLDRMGLDMELDISELEKRH